MAIPGLIALAALLMLAGCGDLPQPFRGRPGGDAARLAAPLAIRIAVPPPSQAMLDDTQSRALSQALAQALQEQEVPAVATDMPWALDWRIEILAEIQGSQVRPRFRLLDADRTAQATTEGAPVPVRDWARADEALYRRVAAQAAPALAQLLLQVQGALKQIDPKLLAAGPPRIRLGGVRGAPGDGNTALAARMREFLGGQGFVVQDSAEGAIYGLNATVTVAPPERGKQRVEIVWIVSRRDGQDLGRVAQINEVPAGALNGFWGDVAYAAAEEAADGVRTVVANAEDRPSEAPAGTRSAGWAGAPGGGVTTPGSGSGPQAVTTPPLRAPPGGIGGPLPPPARPAGR